MQRTYIKEPVGEVLILGSVGVVPGGNCRKSRDPWAPFAKIGGVFEKHRHLNRTIRNPDYVQRCSWIDELLYHVVEDVVDVLLGVGVSRDDILYLVKAVGILHGALLRKSVPRGLGDGFLATAPPSQLSHVGEDYARRIGIAGR